MWIRTTWLPGPTVSDLRGLGRSPKLTFLIPRYHSCCWLTRALSESLMLMPSYYQVCILAGIFLGKCNWKQNHHHRIWSSCLRGAMHDWEKCAPSLIIGKSMLKRGKCFLAQLITSAVIQSGQGCWGWCWRSASHKRAGKDFSLLVIMVTSKGLCTLFFIQTIVSGHYKPLFFSEFRKIETIVNIRKAW